MEITKGIHQIETSYPEMAGVPLYIYLIIDKEVALIDTGVPGFTKRHVAPYLEGLGLKISDITMILNTHGHPDHFGGNKDVKDASGARIFAPLVDAAWVEDHDRHWRELWEAFPGDLSFDSSVRKLIMDDYCGPNTRVDVILRDGDRIVLGEEHVLVVVPTPGHSPGHVSFYDAKHTVAFTGDTVQGMGIPMMGKDTLLGPLYTDVDAYTAGLKALVNLDIAYLLGAHCAAMTDREAKNLLRDSLAYVERADRFIQDTLKEAVTPLSVAQIAEAVGTKLLNAGGVSLQSVGVTTAHLRRLAAIRRVEGSWRFRAEVPTSGPAEIA
jgi:glyoxylase-like metal-dependent hydrolase (beta-lactamase superfamily II)